MPFASLPERTVAPLTRPEPEECPFCSEPTGEDDPAVGGCATHIECVDWSSVVTDALNGRNVLDVRDALELLLVLVGQTRLRVQALEGATGAAPAVSP